MVLVSSLDQVVGERASTLPLAVLRDAVLGIDVEHYLRKLLQSSGKSLLYTPWGGASPLLKQLIQDDLLALRKLDIKPFFVFNGLRLPSEHLAQAETHAATQAASLDLAYRKAEKQALASVFPKDLVPACMQILKTNRVEFLVAPYLAAAQLAYMYNPVLEFLDAIYASCDVALFGVDRIITDINFELSNFSFVDRSTLQGELGGLSQDQLVDSCLISGGTLCPVLPLLDQTHLGTSEHDMFRLRAAADLIRNFRSGTAALQSLQGNPALKGSDYLEKFRKARGVIRHHPHLTRDGDLILLNPNDVPIDAAEYLGEQMPREIHYYLSRGLVSGHVVDSLVSGLWKETVPLDGGETTEYRQVLENLNELRAQCLNLLSQPINRFYQHKPIKTSYWYDPGKQAEIDRSTTPKSSLYAEISSWKVSDDFLNKYAATKKRDVKALLQTCKIPNAIIESLVPKASLETGSEILANCLYRVLQLRSFITSEHVLSPWGAALCDAIGLAEDDLVEPVYIAIELLRLHAIKFEHYSNSYLGVLPNGNEEDQINVQILSQLAALLSLQQSSSPWMGPVDRNALVSTAIVNSVRTYVSRLYDTTLCSLLLNGDATRLNLDFSAISASTDWNPFSRGETDAGCAILIKEYLCRLGNAQNSKDGVINGLKIDFPTAVDVSGDIEKFLKLWDALLLGVKTAAAVGAMGSMEQQKFLHTDEWLKSRR